MLRISFSVPDDLGALAGCWRDLEARAQGSFFQSWSWTGCRAAARFPDPLLLTAERGGAVLGLALFNRRRRPFGERLWLGETGDPAEDSIFVECNGPLVAADAPADLAARMLAAALHLRTPGAGRRDRQVVLSGAEPALAEAARGLPGTLRRGPDRPAPYADLAALREAGGGHLASLSSNSRAQIRRSLRRYAEAGPLVLTRAATLAEAQAFLARLAVLHNAAWGSRGLPGAFVSAAFAAFHVELLERAHPRGEIELLRITAGDDEVGYLYNFIWRGRVLAYQSGFAYPPGDAHRKPGLTCHHLAIEDHLARRMDVYDFLAGGGRYKTSLANAGRALSWLELGSPWRPAALAARLRGGRDAR
jgi:CelD/BcsL family acetyltransferase involved in cellulose biosynthesis